MEGSRHCHKCETTKALSDFAKGQVWCKECKKEYKKEWKSKNPSVDRIYLRWWRKMRKENPDWNIEWRNTVRDVAYRNNYSNNYNIKRRKTDIEFKIKGRLRTRLGELLRSKNIIKYKDTLELAGCDIGFLIKHIENKFEDWMTWENHGKLWHIDHIIPCAFFNLKSEIHQRVCFSYINLQPLEKIKNLSKNSKMLHPEHLHVILNHLNISIDEFTDANKSKRREAEAV